MVDIKDIIGIGYGAINISREKLLNILPQESLSLFPTKEETLLVKINLKDLENIGLCFDTYKVICKIYKKNNNYYLKIC